MGTQRWWPASESISLRIFVVFVTANIAALSLVVLTGFYFSRLATEARTEEHLTSQLNLISERFRTEYLVRLDRDARLLTSLPAVDEFFRVGDAEREVFRDLLYRQFELITKEPKQNKSVYFVDAAGTIQIHLDDMRRQEICAQTFDEDDGSCRTIDPYAHVWRPLFRNLKTTPMLFSSGALEWFMPPRELETSQAFVDRRGDVHFIGGLAKLDVDVGAFAGAVFIRQSLDHFFRELAHTSIYGTKAMWVLDPKGNVLMRPSDGEPTFDPRGLMQKRITPLSAVAKTNKGIVAYRDLWLEPRQPFLTLAFAAPAEVYLQDVEPMFGLLAVSVAMSIVLFALIAVVAARQLTQPLFKLANTASSIADGDLDTPVDVKASGEIKVLVDSFARMTRKLRDAIESRDQSLRRLVDESRQKEKLIHDRLKAEASARAKSDFLAHMSHELRTPLNSILGFTELMRMKLHGPLGSEKYEGYLHDIMRSGGHLLEVINDILDLSKIEAGEYDLHESEIDVRELFEACLTMASARGAADGNVPTVVSELPPDFPGLRGDGRLLRQILINLLSNAVKFTPAEGLVRLGADIGLDGCVVFTVQDTGCGIREEDLARVLEPFGQSRTSAHIAHKGTGLGLTLAQQFARLHGGSLAIESTVGVGTTVSVRLPSCRIVATAVPQPARA